MVEFTEDGGSIVFSVRVVPCASRSEVVGEHDGALRVRVAAAPVEGAANEELIRALAAAFGVPRRAIEIVDGHTSKLKRVRVGGGAATRLAELARD